MSLRRINFIWTNSSGRFKGHKRQFQKLFCSFSKPSNTAQRGFCCSIARLVQIKSGTSFQHGQSSGFAGFQQHVRKLFKHSNVSYIVSVKTGDQLQAGTDAHVRLILHAESEKSESILLDYPFRDDFERGQLDTFQLKNLGHLKDIHKIELWRDNFGGGAEWFVDYIEVEDVSSRKRFMFPLFRWIRANKHYIVRHMDNCLPQFDHEPEYRREELEAKRKEYQCAMRIDGGPAQVRLL